MEIYVGMLGNTTPSGNVQRRVEGRCCTSMPVYHTLQLISVMVIMRDGYSLCVSKLFF